MRVLFLIKEGCDLDIDFEILYTPQRVPNSIHFLISADALDFFILFFNFHGCIRYTIPGFKLSGYFEF